LIVIQQDIYKIEMGCNRQLSYEFFCFDLKIFDYSWSRKFPNYIESLDMIRKHYITLLTCLLFLSFEIFLSVLSCNRNQDIMFQSFYTSLYKGVILMEFKWQSWSMILIWLLQVPLCLHQTNIQKFLFMI
jgi:archaellum biogenesis protein FlaJ (TadC family)